MISSPVADEACDVVSAFASRRSSHHIVISGGFGTGKSFALARVVEFAIERSLPVSELRNGPLGISSYADFLLAVAKDIRRPSGDPAELSRWGSSVGENTRELGLEQLERAIFERTGQPGLVLVVESLDQLIHQIRSADRPRLVDLLDQAPTNVLVVGSVHGPSFANRLGRQVQTIQARGLASIEGGAALARDVARRMGMAPSVSSECLIDQAATLDTRVSSSWLFWSLVGRYLVVAKEDPMRWAVDDLRMRLASHFDAMMLTLAPSEQRVLLTLSEANGPQSVGDLAGRIGVRNQAAATALGRLHANDWVTLGGGPANSDRRRSWYDIADPMLRLYLSPQSS